MGAGVVTAPPPPSFIPDIFKLTLIGGLDTVRPPRNPFFVLNLTED